MKRYSLLLFLGLCSLCTGAQDMKTLFTQIPDAYLPQLEIAWRKDLAELFLAGKDARLQNTMGGYSQLQQLTDNYLMLRVTERSVVELKMLPLINHTYIICMVTTIEGPAPDSRVSFYTTEWQRLDPSALFTPVPPEWFLNDPGEADSDAFRDAIARLDMHLIKYRLSPEDLTLTAIYATPLYLNEEERQKTLPFLKENPKVYTWNRSCFR